MLLAPRRFYFFGAQYDVCIKAFTLSYVNHFRYDHIRNTVVRRSVNGEDFSSIMPQVCAKQLISRQCIACPQQV